MNNNIKIEFIDNNTQHSEYNWANISCNDNRVGKARCHINGKEITIFSIIIFPEYQGNGYGVAFIDYTKQNYKRVIADRVRFTAKGFWAKVGFKQIDEETWVFEN